MRQVLKSTFIYIILSLACSSSNSFAVRVVGLYQTQVPVISQSSAVREQALQQALAQVFIKLSGSSSVISNPQIITALSQPDNILLSYSYQDENLPNGDNSLFLSARFDPKAVRQVLQKTGQNIWGQNRPLVLLWVIYRDSQHLPQMISSATQNIYKAELLRDANLRGLPILFPTLDSTEDQNSLAAAVNDNNFDLIEKASEPYGIDAILIVNLEKNTAENWRAGWALVNQGNIKTWQSNSNLLTSLLKDGIDAATDSLALAYGTLTTAAIENTVQLTVININSLHDYAAVTDYLKDLLPVKRVELQQINPSSLVYNLKVMGGELGLQNALGLDHELQPVTVTPDLQNSNTGLVYQWGS